MLRILAILALCTTTAHAGMDCSDEESVRQLEAFARRKAGADAPESQYIWACLAGGGPAQLKPRIEKACQRIVERDGDKSPCVRVAAAAGIPRLGDHDLFEPISAMEEDPINAAGGIDPYKVTLLARIGDPRGAQVITDMWKTAIPRAEQREKRHGEMRSWSGWRQYAAQALGVLGGADDAAFLDDQAKATRDRFVANACTEAAAAIRKRVAAKP